MAKTSKTALSMIIQRVKIVMLKNKIRKMARSSYLDLYERMELRDTVRSLQMLEQQLGIHNTASLSL